MKNGGEMAGLNVLLVDGDRVSAAQHTALLEGNGLRVTRAESLARARILLEAGRYDVAVVMAELPDGDGTQLVAPRNGGPPVVLMTEHGTVRGAVDAIRRGAADYLVCPVAAGELCEAASRAAAASGAPRETQGGPDALDGLIGADLRMAKVFDLIDAVAAARTTVLLTGESGTGKSLVARAIHRRSPRRSGPFVEVACGALPDTLLESELFGHVKGAFTHAVSDRPGKFAAADGGTIFLDEISTASPQLQVKLLRVLQERQFEPVGSIETRAVDVRVILATNHDLAAEVEAGRFRRDLYYRINVVNIELPPLRDRPGDIERLAAHFLQKYQAEAGRKLRGFDGEAMDRMRRYAWPGNVRELENCVERAVVLCRGATISRDDLPPSVARPGEAVLPKDHAAQSSGLKEAMTLPEKHLIVAALEAAGGNRQDAAARLGINRSTLYKKMKKHGLL